MLSTFGIMAALVSAQAQAAYYELPDEILVDVVALHSLAFGTAVYSAFAVIIFSMIVYINCLRLGVSTKAITFLEAKIFWNYTVSGFVSALCAILLFISLLCGMIGALLYELMWTGYNEWIPVLIFNILILIAMIALAVVLEKQYRKAAETIVENDLKQ